MNALTQYYKACYVPEIEKRKDEIEKMIHELFDKIKDKLDVTDFVIDFVVDKEKVYLIELNHFGPTASPALFDW